MRDPLSIRGSIPMTTLLTNEVYKESLLPILANTLFKVNRGSAAATRCTAEFVKLVLFKSPDVLLVNFKLFCAHNAAARLLDFRLVFQLPDSPPTILEVCWDVVSWIEFMLQSVDQLIV